MKYRIPANTFYWAYKHVQMDDLGQLISQEGDKQGESLPCSYDENDLLVEGDQYFIFRLPENVGGFDVVVFLKPDVETL